MAYSDTGPRQRCNLSRRNTDIMGKKHLTPEIADELDKVELTHNGFVISRIGFALELYFLGGERVETRMALCQMLRDYQLICATIFMRFRMPQCAVMNSPSTFSTSMTSNVMRRPVGGMPLKGPEWVTE